MFTVIVTLDVHEDRIEEFLAGIRTNAHATVRDEPGCIRFDVHRSEDQPNRFHFYEIYVDRDAFEVDHRSAPHYAAWREVVARCVVPGSHVNQFAAPAFPDDIPERPES
jgi:autoinducer 2-degrading protein